MLDDDLGGELRDFRCKITPETGDVLDALAQVTGDEKAAIARQALHEWALHQIHRSKVIVRVARREGAAAAQRGAKA